MERADIMKRVDEPTDWVSPLVLVQKDEKIRVRLDPRNINKSLKTEHYQLPKREDIEGKLAGARLSSLDANAGFYQIPLDGKTLKLCMLAISFGWYCFLRLPFIRNIIGTGSISEDAEQNL